VLNKNNAFVRQAAILAGAGLITKLLGFAYRVALTGVIGDYGIGIGGIAFYIYMFFWVMSSAGLPVAISKMVSERVAGGRPDEARRVFHIALFVAALLGVTFSLILFFGSGLIVTLMGWPRSYYALLSLTPTVFFVAIMAVFRGYFQGMQNTVPTALSQLIEQLFNAVFSVLLALLMLRHTLPYEYGGDPVAMGAAGGQLGTSVGAFAGLAFILGYYLYKRRHINKSIHFYSIGNTDKKQSIGSIVRELAFITIPIIMGTAIFTISNIIDGIMVRPRLIASGIVSDSVISELVGQLVGKYVTITNVPVMVSTALAIAAIPSIAASIVKREHQAVTEKTNTAMRLSMLITIPAAVGIGVLANPILRLLFPTQPGGGSLLMVGSISIIFLALYQILAGMLQAIGKLHIPVIAAFIGASLKIPLNYVLIANPNLRIVGAVISTIVCYVVASAICWYFFTKHVKFKINLTSTFIKPAIAAFGMGLGIFVAYYTAYFLTGVNALATILSVLIGMALYVSFLLLIGGLRKSDVQLLPAGHRICAALERRHWL